ncbi:YqaA family protein [Ahrensia sp. R2A130]|uniref:YqaA family protein n=1 Tax=Ahrensia sp. R2A130 TaxID=744979 RepID=UPI0001E0F096|nr:YqaA family protein [Ahrensia sp. R2A130]EFL89893.1 inner membrane protein YqaA [Ahrensia sp. R2A130]
MSALTAYGGLFLSAFVAATLFPAQSEIVLIALISSGTWSVFWLVVVASVGNTLGSVVNYYIGRATGTFSNAWWFPVSELSLKKAEGWYHRYGRWSLLLSWAPFIGDPITVVAGFLKEPISSFVVLVAIAKTCRYIVLALIVMGVL